MNDADLIARTYAELLAWLKPDPQPSSDETLLRIIELFEGSGREFVKVDWPANDGA